MILGQLAPSAGRGPSPAVATLSGLALLGASLLLPLLLRVRKSRRGPEASRSASEQRARSASEDSAQYCSGASSSDTEEENDNVSALFRVAELAPHVRTTFETVPRRRGRRTVNLFLRTLEPPQARGVVLLLHGLNGHSGHGSNLWTAALLANNGFIVRAVDHEGHGRSAADDHSRVFFQDVDAMAADVADILRDSAHRSPGLPHFLMGISFGGCLALKSTLALEPEERRRLVAGLVLQCPFIEAAQESTPGPLVRAAARALSALAPHLPIAGANCGRGANPAIQKTVSGLMKSDKLCYKGKLRIGTALALVAASESLRRRLPEVDVPFLVQHGGADRVVAAEGSRRLFRLAVSADKQIKIYDDASHNLMHELPGTLEAIRGDYIAWINERVAAAAAPPGGGAAAAAGGRLVAALGASNGAAAAAASAASLLLRRATSSVAPETLAIAAAALAAFGAAASVPPTQQASSGSSSSTSTSSGGSSVWGDRHAPSAEEALSTAGGSASDAADATAELLQEQEQPLAAAAAAAGGEEDQQAAAVRKLGAEPLLAGWALELRRTSSGVSAATLLAHAAALAEGRGRLGRRRV